MATLTATGWDLLGQGLDNWEEESLLVSNELIVERSLDKQVTQILHYPCVPLIPNVTLPEQPEKEEDYFAFVQDQDKMKDMASIVGQLGGLYTALFIILLKMDECCTRRKFQ